MCEGKVLMDTNINSNSQHCEQSDIDEINPHLIQNITNPNIQQKFQTNLRMK